MIKVIHLITGLGLGGAENQLVHLVTQSDKSQFQHIVISMQDNGILGNKLLTDGIKLYSLGMERGTPSIKACVALVKILRTERPDILQTWLYHADLLGFLVGKWARVPKIVWNVRCSNMNTQYYSVLTSLVIKACAFLSRFPDAVIVNSNAGKTTHQELGYRVKNWLNIPNGFKTEDLKPDIQTRQKMRSLLKCNETNILIGMIARFDPMKDHDSFLLALQILKQKLKNFRVLLIGTDIDASNSKLMAKIVELGLEKYISLLGPRQDIPVLMNALDVVVLSSSFGEGFSNVLGEAMACGIPCVATNVGDNAEIIGGIGKIVPIKDPAALAQAIEELLSLDKQQKQILGSQARQRMLERYAMPKIIKRYEKTYRWLSEMDNC